MRPRSTRTCSVPGCNDKHYGRGWCQPHYKRWWRTGTPVGAQTQRLRGPERICELPGCGRSHRANGWCRAHYYLARTHGDPLGSPYPRWHARDEERELWARVTPLVRADLRAAMAAWRVRAWHDVRHYIARAQSHGRRLSHVEQRVVDGMLADYCQAEEVSAMRRRVADLTERGASGVEIARRLGVEPRTVSRHRRAIRKGEAA